MREVSKFMRLKRLGTQLSPVLTSVMLGALPLSAFAQSAQVTPVSNGGAVSATPIAPATGSNVASATAPGQVVVGGKVPDEATREAVLAKLRNTYGAANVVDQI